MLGFPECGGTYVLEVSVETGRSCVGRVPLCDGSPYVWDA
jgi:hypothetical protein